MLITSRLLALIMLVAALWAPAGPVMAETGDITGSTNANGAVSTPVYSPQFADALSLIENGKYADAYQLARGFVSTPERRAIQWAAIYYGKGEIDFDSVKRFEADAPDMATQTLYRTRIEQSIIKLDPGPGQVIALLGGQMPVLTDAQIALAQARRDLVVASYAALSAIGKLDVPTLKLAVARYEPEDHYQAVKDKWYGLRTPDGQ